MWLLLIEDEKRLATTLKEGLEEEGYTVDVAADGQEGEDLALANAYDALIVDWRLPRQDGKKVIESVRRAGRQYPILMLTAMSDVEHRVAGLDAGADDYLAKPFKFEELLARLRALMRRQPLASQDFVLTQGSLVMDTRRREVTVDGALMMLRPKEYGILELFLRDPNAALSRTIIAERVWGDAYYVSDNAIDVTVSSLRQKLADAQSVVIKEGFDLLRIDTVRGMGYKLSISETT